MKATNHLILPAPLKKRDTIDLGGCLRIATAILDQLLHHCKVVNIVHQNDQLSKFGITRKVNSLSTSYQDHR